MQSVQEEDRDIRRLRDWVKNDRKPQPEEMDAEGQEMRAMCSRWKEMTVREEILYRKSKYGLQAVLPGALRIRIFQQVHGLAHVGGHLGRDRTYQKARSRVWWPGYKGDLARWVKSCHSCQLAKPGPGRGRLPLIQERAGSTFERVALDLVGPLPVSQGKDKYLLVIQDCFSKWLEVIPIRNKTTLTVTEAFVAHWVSRFGSPRILHQDNGSEFTSTMFKEMCDVLGIARTTTTPYHPQSNGQVERVNQTVQNMMKCICTETGKDWAEVAGLAASAYRAAQHESTGFTPNRMVLGRENATPLCMVKLWRHRGVQQNTCSG